GAAPAEVLSLRVLAEDDEVDRAGIAQRRQVRMQQLHRPEIDVQIELESQTQENVAGMLIAGDARIAEGAEEDRIDVVAQMTKTGFRQRLFRFEVMVGGIRKVFPVQRESVLGRDAIEYRDR